MSNFYDTVIRNSRYFGSDVVCKDMNMLEPGTRAAVTSMLADAKAQNIDLRVLETYRSQTRQSALFMRRATQLRTVGCHGYGVACDFGVFENGQYATNEKPYQFLDALARRHGLVSGLTWGHNHDNRGFIDSGHVQRCRVEHQNALFSGAWYPPVNYDPYDDSAASHHDDVVLDLGAPPVKLTPKPAPVSHVAPHVHTVPPEHHDWLAELFGIKS